jgi:hypothetical protein
VLYPEENLVAAAPVDLLVDRGGERVVLCGVWHAL